MNNSLFEYLLSKNNYQEYINQWINGDYKNKILIINGKKGNFKSSLSEYILREHSILRIDIENCKTKFNFNEFINLKLNKISINSIISNFKKEKALIIDDLNYILKSDKKLFQSICNWFFKINEIKNPIIMIINNIDNNNLKKIYLDDKVKIINLDINDLKEYIYIMKTFFLKDNHIDVNEIKKLIIKSNYNFNSIKINIEYYKDNFKNINKFKVDNYNSIDILKNVINKYEDYDIDDIINDTINDYNIISLNIIDNLPIIIDDINIIDNIYQNYLYFDNYYYSINNNYKLIEYLMIFNIIYPLYLINKNKDNNKDNFDISYNRYICRSIIYIKNRNNNYNEIIKLFMNIDKDNLYYNKNVLDKYDDDKYTKMMNILNNYKYFSESKITKKLLKKILKDKNKI